MARGLGRKIKELRGDLSQAEFAKRLGVSQPQVHRWEKDVDTPTEPNIRKLAKMARQTVAEFVYGVNLSASAAVPVVSYIGAGERVLPIDDAGEYDTVNIPAGVMATADLRAMRVRGDSMRPLRDDWVIYYREPGFPGVADNCFAGPCVVETMDGELYVKELVRGTIPGHFHLVSWNQATAIMQDVAIRWATPVVAIVPPEAANPPL